MAKALITLPRRSGTPATAYLDDESGEEPDPYTKVDDLGEAAGFGPFRDTTMFAVITSDDEHVYRVVLQVENLDVTVEQARPLAESMLDGLGG